MTGFGVAVLWAVAAAAVAVVLWARGGGWYRSEWLGGWREWTRDDLFGLAEKAYVVLARIFFRGDRLLEVQLRNLCRCREGSAAGPFDLVGGSFVWLWAGLAVGAAPVLRGSPDAGALFVLVVGGWATSVSARAPFADLRGSLYVDAEGRQAGLYRAAGVGAIELYRAKLRAGRLVAGVALGAVTALGVVLGGLSLGSCLLLTAIGVASWTIWPHTELLPGLASPHFGWEHPDELGTHHEQRGLRDLTEGIVGVFSIFDLLLIVLLLSGWLPSAGFTGVAVALVLLKTAAASATFRALGHRAARATDRTDLCS